MDNKKQSAEGTKVCACMTCHDHGSMYGGTCCCCHGGGRFSILRVVIGVVLLIFVFWFGVKVGEIKSLFDSGSQGRYMMMHVGYGNMGGGYPGNGGAPVPSAATTTANGY